MWQQTELSDVFDMANNIAYYADRCSSDVYAGFIWKWIDGGDGGDNTVQLLHSDSLTDSDESKDETASSQQYRLQGLLAKIKNVVAADVNDPVSVLGFKCGAN